MLYELEECHRFHLGATCCRDIVTQAKPDSHSSVVSESESGEPPAKKPHIEEEHKKTVKRVCLVYF